MYYAAELKIHYHYSLLGCNNI